MSGETKECGVLFCPNGQDYLATLEGKKPWSVCRRPQFHKWDEHGWHNANPDPIPEPPPARDFDQERINFYKAIEARNRVARIDEKLMAKEGWIPSRLGQRWGD